MRYTALLAAIGMAAGFVLGSSGIAAADQTFIITVDQDAWVNEANPTANYGNNTYMSVKDRSGLAEAYIRFSQEELGALAGKPVTAASLFLYQYQGTNSPGDSIAVHRVGSEWNESGVSWDTRPVYDAFAVSALELSGENNTAGWREWPGLECVVSGWSSTGGTGANNFGLALENNRDMAEGELYARFYSSEYSNAAFRPYLKVTAAPEPVSMLLFGIGGGILAIKRRGAINKNSQ
ncbi:MAG TPA: DNRLRE domain-containing protein [Candidatus Omnitrophota bacterium]|nr:DNRLRE domain-containing protein [Candidatus Omnitrophota bacterium]